MDRLNECYGIGISIGIIINRWMERLIAIYLNFTYFISMHSLLLQCTHLLLITASHHVHHVSSAIQVLTEIYAVGVGGRDVGISFEVVWDIVFLLGLGPCLVEPMNKILSNLRIFILLFPLENYLFLQAQDLVVHLLYCLLHALPLRLLTFQLINQPLFLIDLFMQLVQELIVFCLAYALLLWPFGFGDQLDCPPKGSLVLGLGVVELAFLEHALGNPLLAFPQPDNVLIQTIDEVLLGLLRLR